MAAAGDNYDAEVRSQRSYRTTILYVPDPAADELYQWLTHRRINPRDDGAGAAVRFRRTLAKVLGYDV